MSLRPVRISRAYREHVTCPEGAECSMMAGKPPCMDCEKRPRLGVHACFWRGHAAAWSCVPCAARHGAC